MKVISLNVWGGRGGIVPLLDFFRRYADTDVFCLQEIWNGGEEMIGKIAGGVPLLGIETRLLEQIRSVLPAHRAYFRPCFRDYYGLLVLVREAVPVLEESEAYIYESRGFVAEWDAGDHARNLQWVTLDLPSGACAIYNVHGLWNGKGKGDSDARMRQSDAIVSVLAQSGCPYILAGDLNLLPDTESMRKLELSGLRNLITENGILSTRTSFHTKADKFADYMLVSDGIDVKEFKVLPDEVSDHAPLYLEFELS